MRIQDRMEQALEAGQLFHAGVFVTGAAAVFPCIQLLNPVGSQKIVEIFYMGIGTFAATSTIGIYRHDTALASLSANNANALLGGAAPTTEARYELLAGFGGITLLAHLYGRADLEFRAGVYQLEPGKGILITDLTAAASAVGRFTYWERPQ